MASPAWLTQEAKPPALNSESSSAAAGQPIVPGTPIIAPVSVSGTGDSVHSNQPSMQPKFSPSPGHVLRAASFTYEVVPNANANSGSIQQSSTTPPNAIGNMGVNNSPSLALQPPIPPQSTHPMFFVPRTALSSVPPPIPFPVSIPHRASSNTTNFCFSGNAHLGPKEESSTPNGAANVPKDGNAMSSSAFSTVHTSAGPTTTVSSTPNFSQASILSSNTPSFAPPSGPMPPGLPPLRPIMPVGPLPSNPGVQPQVYSPYPTMPSVGNSPQALWVHPPPTGGPPRPPFLPYPPVYPGPFSLAARGMSLPSVPLPDAQPPGVTPVINPGGVIPSSVQPDAPPPGTDDNKQINDGGTKNDAILNDKVDAWSAHRTEAGVVYYYNALTGESTYEKPPSFKGEPGNAAVQPTPVAWEKVAGTDWALVTTNDGKKYYYNSKSEISSWQVPIEVTELRKKQESDNLKEHSIMSVANPNALSEKASGATSLSAPALNTGGRDSIALRTSGVPVGSPSALDLIKKKLQDTAFPTPTSSGSTLLEINGSKGVESEGSKDKPKDGDGDGNVSDSSSDSEDEDSGPTRAERIIQFKEMLKERGVAPFSKWDKELPKFVFDPRFKAIPTYAERRSLFEHYVRTRAEEERKEKRAAQKAAVEGFKQLLEEAKEDIDHNTDYHTFRKRWGHDPRFEALERKEREVLLNERVLSLKRVVDEKAQAERAIAASNFKSMLRERGDITANTRWSRVKDGIRDDPRYKAVKHEEREILFNEYISDLKAADDEAEREAKAKRDEQDKLKERERELRKRKEREEQEMERVRVKIRRKDAISSYQALLVETIKDPQASWTESKPKLEKDPQRRASNPDLDESDLEKLFREHVKMLYERCSHEFKTLLVEVITPEAVVKETGDGKTVVSSWSTAKRLLKSDPRYTKMPRKDREALWKRHAEEIQRKQKLAGDQKGDKHNETRNKSSHDSGRIPPASRSGQERR